MTSAAKHTAALRRDLSQYAMCSAVAISQGSQAQMRFFVADAQHDIATLAERCERLEASLKFVATDPCFSVLGSVTKDDVAAALARCSSQVEEG